MEYTGLFRWKVPLGKFPFALRLIKKLMDEGRQEPEAE